jgi:hypothetical protein
MRVDGHSTKTLKGLSAANNEQGHTTVHLSRTWPQEPEPFVSQRSSVRRGADTQVAIGRRASALVLIPAWACRF